MPDMQRFGNVRPAVVNDDGAGIFNLGKAAVFALAHFFQITGDEFVFDGDVDKPGGDDGNGCDDIVGRQCRSHVIGDCQRSFAILFGGGHGAVALKLA